MPKPTSLIALIAAAVPALALAQTTPDPAPQPAPAPSPPTIFTPKAPETKTEIAALPTASREAPVNGVLFLYGDKEKCPTDANGNEIVVCVRKPAGERFRIPKEIRPESIKREYQSFAVRQDGINDTGAAGIGSCSTIGAGGQTGCITQQNRRWKRERNAQKEAEAANTPQ